MNTRRSFISLIIVTMMVTTGCGRQAEMHEVEPTPVRVQTVALSATSNGIRYSATITPYEQVDLQFKAGGYIRELLQVRGMDGRPRVIQQGDTVTKGLVLAWVRESDYVERVKQAKAQLTQTEASLQKAQQDWRRADRLFAAQSLTKPDYDSAKAQLDSAQANVAGARARLEEARLDLQDCALAAPMNGVLLQRKIEVGALASPGEVGFILGDLSFVKVIFGVPDSLLTQLKLGASLTITTESLRGAKFSGQITAISPAADARSRVFNIEVTVPNPKHALKAGMIASLEVTNGPTEQPTPLTPLSAIVRSLDDPNGYAVFVVEEQEGTSVARLRKVQLGDVQGNAIATIAGLKAGEQLIVTGAALVSDGEVVRIIP